MPPGLYRASFFIITLLALARSASAQPQLGLQVVASNLSAPLGFVQVPGSPTTQVILEQAGRIRVLENGALQPTDFLDLTGTVLSGGEKGLLGLAFSPNFATDGRVFVCFIDQNGNSVVARFLRATSTPLTADPASRFDFVWPGGAPYIAQPVGTHLGGHLAFGPDGALYLGLGDGGAGNDPDHNAQNPLVLYGKMLRLNVTVADTDPEGYDVPADNPFAGREDVLPEIWAFGLRNPWRWSFDEPALGGTGALIIGDVGQAAREEVNYEPAGRGGRNYGWRNKEGLLDHITDLPPWSEPLTDPVIDFTRDLARSITGGYVYRGNALGTAYASRYFVGDFVRGNVWTLGLALDAAGEATVVDLVLHATVVPVGLASFGQDAAGELYVVDYFAGTVSKIILDTSGGGGGGGGTCTPPDPYAAIGGGRCVHGAWLPTMGTTVPAPVRLDINADSAADLVWQHTNGNIYAWLVNNLSFTSGAFITPSNTDPLWQVAATADLSGDGKPDLLFQHEQTGQLRIWLLDATTMTGEVLIPMAANTPWRVRATGDFNNDGANDLVWQNPTTGEAYIWFMATSGGVPQFAAGGYLRTAGGVASLGPDTPWRIVGTGDVNGDNKTDLLWQDDSLGYLAAWYMDSTLAVQGVDLAPPVVPDTTWKVRAVGDYSGDSKPDLIWQNLVTGDLFVWILNGPSLAAETLFTPARVLPAWRIAGQR